MKRTLLAVGFLLIALLSASIGHRIGYRQGQHLAARPAEAVAPGPSAEPTTPVPAPQPEIPRATVSPRMPEWAREVQQSPAPTPSPIPAEPKPGTGTIVLDGSSFKFSLGPNPDPNAPPPTGDRARYSGIAVLEENLGINETQVLRMFEWLKRRDEAYGMLSQIKDPATHAAQGQALKDYYESLFRSELTPEQQVKYEALKQQGSFSFRGPPALEK